MEVTTSAEALRRKRAALGGSATTRAATRVNAICATAHMAFYALFLVMRCRQPTSLREIRRSKTNEVRDVRMTRWCRSRPQRSARRGPWPGGVEERVPRPFEGRAPHAAVPGRQRARRGRRRGSASKPPAVARADAGTFDDEFQAADLLQGRPDWRQPVSPLPPPSRVRRRGGWQVASTEARLSPGADGAAARGRLFGVIGPTARRLRGPLRRTYRVRAPGLVRGRVQSASSHIMNPSSGWGLPRDDLSSSGSPAARPTTDSREPNPA